MAAPYFLLPGEIGVASPVTLRPTPAALGTPRGIPIETLKCPQWPGCASADAPPGCCALADELAETFRVDRDLGLIFVPDPRTGVDHPCEFYPLTGRWLNWLLKLGYGERDARLSLRHRYERGEYHLADCGVVLGAQPPQGPGIPGPGEFPGPGGIGPPAQPGIPPGFGPGLPLPGGLEAQDLPEIIRRLLGGESIGESLSVLAPILAQVVIAILGTERTLAALGASFDTKALPALFQQAAAQEGGTSVLAEILRAIAGGPGDRAVAGARLAATAQGQALFRVLEAAFERLRELATAVLEPAFNGLRRVAQTVVEESQELFVTRIERAVEPGGGNVGAVAGEALLSAMTAGLTAQILSLLLEAVHPLKNLGLHQVAAWLADFGGFGDIASALRSPTIRWALAAPMEHRAAARFRTEIPGTGDVLAQAYQRHIPESRFRELYRMHGLPEWWIDVVWADRFVDPRPTELARLLDGSEVDTAWIANNLREHGWDDRGVEEGTRGLVWKMWAPGRQRLLSSVVNAYRDGHLSEEQLDAELEGAVAQAGHREMWKRAAVLDRRRHHADRVAVQVLRQYRDGTRVRESAGELLAALALTPTEIETRLLTVDLESERLQIREAVADAEAEVRRARTEATRLLQMQHRLGLLTDRELQEWAVRLGYPEAWAATVAAIARLQPPPKPQEGAPMVGTAALERTVELLQVDIAAQVRAGTIDAGAARGLLRDLGRPSAAADLLIDIAEILARGTRHDIPGALLSEGERERTWESILGVVRGQVGERDLGARVVREVLERLGLPRDVAGRLDDVLVDLIGRLFAVLG